MTASNAAQYADSLLATIRANVDEFAPFGWIEPDSDLWTNDREEATENALEEASALDYVRNALDMNYTVSANSEYRSGRVYVTIGGPNAYIDTESRELVVSWDNTERRSLPATFIDGLDDALSELWSMGA